MLKNTNKFLKYIGWLALINPLVLVKANGKIIKIINLIE